ncbi:hypothetical protein Tco_1117869, partial [Tanacetum coccineum]
ECGGPHDGYQIGMKMMMKKDGKEWYAQTKSTNILDVVNDAVLSKKGYWREDEWVWNWVWRRSDLSGRAVNDVHNLSDLVQDFRLKKDNKDKCKWRLNDGGSFTVKGLRDLVDSKILEPTGSIFETSWCKLIPKKCASLFSVCIIGESHLE